MNYRIIIQPRAEREIEAAYRWIAERSPRGAVKWYNGLQKAIQSLSRYPRRCSLAPESEAFDWEIRNFSITLGNWRS